MYKLIKNPMTGIVDLVLRIEDHTCIPMVETNLDYQVYLKWLDAGNTPLPADE